MLSFESRVILDGSQTRRNGRPVRPQFESRVILDGSQTAEMPRNYAQLV